MTGLDPEEIKRIKTQPVKCTKCKLAFMVKPSEKVSCLWEYTAEIIEAITRINILCQTEFQRSDLRDII